MIDEYSASTQQKKINSLSWELTGYPPLHKIKILSHECRKYEERLASGNWEAAVQIKIAILKALENFQAKIYSEILW